MYQNGIQISLYWILIYPGILYIICKKMEFFVMCQSWCICILSQGTGKYILSLHVFCHREEEDVFRHMKDGCILSWLPKLVDATAGTLVFCQTVQTEKKSSNLVTLSLSHNDYIIHTTYMTLNYVFFKDSPFAAPSQVAQFRIEI